MIKRIRHKGLKRFYETGDLRGISAGHTPTLRLLLTSLEVAEKPADMSNPSYGLHPLKGDLKRYWAVWVSGNWQLIFIFEDEGVTDIDLVDYH